MFVADGGRRHHQDVEINLPAPIFKWTIFYSMENDTVHQTLFPRGLFADFNRGVFRLHIAKTGHAQPRKIKVA